MAKISIQVRSGAARFVVGVQAPTIQQALDLAATRYSGNVASVQSPIEKALPLKPLPLEWN